MSASEQIRIDAGNPIESRLDDNGFLRVSGVAAREGIYTYRNADGSIRRELVTADVLRDDAANSGLVGLPVTVEHPRDGLLNAHTARLHMKGSTTSAKFDSGSLNVEMVVTNADAIEAISGGTRQLSPGYRVTLDYTPGVWNGEHYDAKQIRRQYNHLSIVARGRGSDCDINLDGEAVDFENHQESAMPTVNLPSGVTVNVDDASTATAIQDAINNLRTDAEEMVSKEKFDALQAKFDELQGKMDEMKEKEDKTDSADVIADRLDSMLDVLDKARKLKPEIELRKDGKLKSEADLMTEALDANFDGKSDEYIKGRFDTAVELQGKGVDSIKRQRTVNTDSAAKGPSAVEQYRQKFLEGKA